MNVSGQKILITGASGFVAPYLVRELLPKSNLIYGLSKADQFFLDGLQYYSCDLLKTERVQEVVSKIKPNIVIHLASQSSVGTSWENEWQTIKANVKSTFNLLKGIEELNQQTRTLIVSSGEVYGDLKRKSRVTDQLAPLNPYATSKAMTEMLTNRFRTEKNEILIARSYNHTGAGRDDRFFESYVAMCFAKAKKEGLKTLNLSTGNIKNLRDYSSVVSVVKKYIWMIENGTSGNVYNVCSGTERSLHSIIDYYSEVTGITVKLTTDESRLRKNDVQYSVGQNDLAHVVSNEDDLLRQSLLDLLMEHESKI